MANVEQASEYLFRVASDSNAKTFYIVDLTPGSFASCTCPAYAISRNRAGGMGHPGKCKHLERAMRFAQESGIVHAQAVEKERKAAEDEFETLRTVESLKRTLKDLG